MRRPKPDRFLNWVEAAKKECEVVANSVLPHDPSMEIVSIFTKEDGSTVSVCKNCDSYVRAAKWLSENGKGIGETAVFAAAQVVRTGVYEYVPPPGMSHMTRNVFHHLSKWAKAGLLTKDTNRASPTERTVVTFRLTASRGRSEQRCF